MLATVTNSEVQTKTRVIHGLAVFNQHKKAPNMTTKYSQKDIVAIKKIDGKTGGLVYLGALRRPGVIDFISGREAPNPGTWMRREDVDVAAPAYSPDGRVGDYLAVSSTENCNQLQALHGNLVALRQASRMTHLGVVRSDRNLEPVVANEEGGKIFRRYIWLEILAMDPIGFELGAPFDGAHHPFDNPGGKYIQIDSIANLSGTEKVALRERIWDGFRTIAHPSRIATVARSAWRP